LSLVIVGDAVATAPADVVVSEVVVVSAVVVAASAVVASVVAASVVAASVDAPVPSEEVEVVVELVSEASADSGSPSATALEAITPSSSNATHAAATLPNPNLVFFVRSPTVVPLSSPQVFVTRALLE
jgi:hypothetical protein